MFFFFFRGLGSEFKIQDLGISLGFHALCDGSMGVPLGSRFRVFEDYVMSSLTSLLVGAPVKLV